MTNELRSDHSDVQVTVCPDGPLLVRGPARIVDADGHEVPRTRRTVALCRCGKSGLAPWCDGTHKVIGFHEPAPIGPVGPVGPTR